MGASIWAVLWLLFLGIFLVFSSAILKWLNFPFSHHPRGLQLPLLRNIELLPHLSLLSYGVLGVCVLATGLALLWRSDTFLAVAAAILIAFWAAAPCQIAFQQPALIRRLNAETQDLPMIRGFAKSYLPVNYGPAEEYSKHFELDTVWDRFVAAYSFLGLGWYCFGIGSLLIATYSIGRLPGERGTTALALGGIPIGVLIIFLTPPLMGSITSSVPAPRRPGGIMKRPSRLIAKPCGGIDGAGNISISTQLLEISKGYQVQVRTRPRGI